MVSAADGRHSEPASPDTITDGTLNRSDDDVPDDENPIVYKLERRSQKLNIDHWAVTALKIREPSRNSPRGYWEVELTPVD